jgi:hypothetical protein
LLGHLEDLASRRLEPGELVLVGGIGCDLQQTRPAIDLMRRLPGKVVSIP